ncbi:hypothetical protein [Ancylomarina longa]|uniref:Uncharacterized protein n=1 Tax=Ancylomarina longa TaxID=2487017 RepID=A0A434AF94_9BACT|nr:hypothetical protein [Ancylomarina longa]RUT73040.1 hypothetical protein DLK05_15320 [Ancylomarina longa]
MEQAKNSSKTVKTVVGLIIGLGVAFLVKQFLFTPVSFDKAMMQAASQINESCPIMVDQETRLDNAIALPDNILQYNYTLVKMVKDSIDIAAFQNYMQPMIENNVKTNPDLKMYRDNKTTMAYNYRDKNGVFLTKILITSKQYQN